MVGFFVICSIIIVSLGYLIAIPLMAEWEILDRIKIKYGYINSPKEMIAVIYNEQYTYVFPTFNFMDYIYDGIPNYLMQNFLNPQKSIAQEEKVKKEYEKILNNLEERRM